MQALHAGSQSSDSGQCTDPLEAAAAQVEPAVMVAVVMVVAPAEAAKAGRATVAKAVVMVVEATDHRKPPLG